MAKSMSAQAAKADIHPTTPKRQLLTRSGLRARPARLLLSPVAVTLPMPEFAPVPMATDLSNLSLRSWQRSSCLFSAVAPRVINFRGGRSVRPRCLLLAQRRRQPSFFRHGPHGSVAGLDVPLSRPLVTQTQTQIATSTTWDFCKRLPGWGIMGLGVCGMESFTKSRSASEYRAPYEKNERPASTPAPEYDGQYRHRGTANSRFDPRKLPLSA